MSTVRTATYLHVANGYSTTKTIDAGSIPGRTSIWADVLHEGPVPGDVGDDELLDIRARHLAASSGESYEEVRAGLRGWRNVIAHHDQYDELVLWFEHDLFDQLNLIQLLTWIHRHLPGSKTVSLICVGSFPGHPKFKGLGELNADELASLFEIRHRVHEEHYVQAEDAWRAFRSDTPEAVDALRRTRMTALPFLSTALTRLLQEYPWTRDGLSRTERRLLQLVEQEPVTLNDLFPRMHEGEEYYITDLALADMVHTLSNTTPPLASFTHGEGERLFRGVVGITDAGRETLSGARDRLSTGAIDRWIGGVHIRPGGTIWRWDNEWQSVRQTQT